MMTVAAHAQFVNNGATVTIQSGATLRVETSFENQAGTITIDNGGILEVQGNFTNAAGAGTTISPTGKVRFIGTGNSDVTLNGDAIHHVEMAKTTSTGKVTLLGNTSINGNLEFTGTGNNKIELGNFDLNLATASTVSATTDHTTNGYVVTNGTGRLVKGVTNGSGPRTITHEIGDVANYSPLSNAVSGTYSNATLGARTVDAIHPNKPIEADSYISRYWSVTANGISSYTNTMTGTYTSSGDVNGTASRIKGGSYVSPNWTFTAAATNGSSTVTGSTTNNILDFTGMNALNKMDLVVFLSGPMSGTSMTNALQIYDPDGPGPLISLLNQNSPYGAPISTYSDIGNPLGVAGQVVDWVKVEVRDATNPTNIRETRSLLLKTNGHIIDPSGNIPYFKDHGASVRFAIHHRNHMAILSNAAVGVFEGKNEAYNTSTFPTQVANSDQVNNPQLRQRNGIWCMVSGDLNGDLVLDGNDPSLFFTPFNNGDFDAYLNSDLNLDGVMDGNDPPHFFYGFNIGLFSEILNY